ncbi:putative Pyridoxal phosphate phosphatase PHOSPHO2 [Hypsibius exemplaris]|uniref:Pyridoxal phosphate phosphatase PHOSPHO2 n=1 Tax=Hypsibius exemplaris TaxID=2072580 RepID=A0A1W0WYD0_HYPEX|nr:putative Pyridoxal phosphate phosphatase PHOSPHO2 [Hypsibius exemplaris]
MLTIRKIIRVFLVPPLVKSNSVNVLRTVFVPAAWPNQSRHHSTVYPRVRGMGSPAVSAAARHLVVFDFDQTIVDVDTYTTVAQMAPLRGHALPEQLATAPKREGWVEYIHAILQFNYANKITSEEIRMKLQSLPLVPGMPELLEYLRANRLRLYDTVILSDANMCFIQWILEKFRLSDCFLRVFSNPAEVDEKGHLLVGRYHEQTDCQLSPKNMCKGRVLQEWMAERERVTGIAYESVYYVGDGENDLCPGKRLTARDIFFVRRDFPLARKLVESPDVQCAVELWSDGFDVMKRLKELG